jgi:hypothetical protein
VTHAEWHHLPATCGQHPVLFQKDDFGAGAGVVVVVYRENGGLVHVTWDWTSEMRADGSTIVRH